MKLCILTFFLGLSFKLGAQAVVQYEFEIANLEKILGTAKTDAERLATSEEMKTLFEGAFRLDEVFDYPFEKLINVATITSPDRRFRFINWSVPLLDGSYHYECYLIFPDGGDLIEMTDVRDVSPGESIEKLGADSWYGALYYYIHPFDVGKETHYLLLGWDGNNSLTTKKMIDILSLTKKNKLSLGAPQLGFAEGKVGRRVFEYADEVMMTLKYMKPKEALVFDHLEPTEPGLKDQYAFYGPSNSHDAYQLNKKGEWELIEGFDMSRPASEDSGLPFNFPQRPDLDKIKR